MNRQFDKRKRPASKREGPGRPQGRSVTRAQILDAAEGLFAEKGYAGTSLREIADHACVTQALLNYYFGSKEGLFIEVYMRRGKELASQRMEGLEELRQSGKPYALDDVIRAFIQPALTMRSSPSGRQFIKLQARVHIEADDLAYSLRREVYDESTKAYVNEIERIVPHLTQETIYWRLVQFIGSYLYLISDAHRLRELSAGESDPDDDAEFLRQVMSYSVGAFLAADPAQPALKPSNAPPPRPRVRTHTA